MLVQFVKYASIMFTLFIPLYLHHNLFINNNASVKGFPKIPFY